VLPKRVILDRCIGCIRDVEVEVSTDPADDPDADPSDACVITFHSVLPDDEEAVGLAIRKTIKAAGDAYGAL
jgi:hypothetical protein